MNLEDFENKNKVLLDLANEINNLNSVLKELTDEHKAIWSELRTEARLQNYIHVNGKFVKKEIV